MKKFRAVAVMRTYFELEIEAETLDEAQELARDADGGDFTPIKGDQGDWEIYDVVESEEQPHHQDCPASDGFGCRCQELREAA